MALIIPEAQTAASIVQQPRQNPNAPSGAEGLGAVGDIFVQLGARKVAAENDRTVRQARIATLQALDEARLKYETTGDLENLSANWEAEAKAITAKAAEAVPVHMRKGFGVAMQEMVAPQTSAIKRREFALYQDRETAALNSDLRSYEKSAARAPDPESRDKIMSEAAADLGRAVTAGLISAVDADRMLADLPANTARVEAITLMDEDPAAYLERGDEFASVLDPKEHAQNVVTAKRLVEADTAKTARQDELAAASLDKQLGLRADDAIEVIESGLPLKDIVPLLTELQGTPHYDRVVGALDANATAGNFALLPPSEQAKEIARMQATPTGNPADVGRINRLKDIQKRSEEGLSADRLGYIRERGINPVDPVDIGDRASVQGRIAVAEEVHRSYTPGASTIAYFDQAEAERYGAILSGNDPDAALGVIANVMNTFQDRAPAALAQLGEKDPLGQLAGALVLDTGDTAAARMMLTGRKLKAEGKAAAVSGEVRRGVAAELAPLFPASDTARLKTLLDAADAHYAASGIGIADPKSPEARAGYMASVQAITGGQTEGGGSWGGIQTVNGKAAVLPPRMSAFEVEQAVNAFSADAWKRASLSGELPMWGKETTLTDASASDRAKIGVLSLGSGMYALGYTRADGSTVYLRDPTQKDGLFRFDMELLVKGVRQ
jgi:ribosomal protein S20